MTRLQIEPTGAQRPFFEAAGVGRGLLLSAQADTAGCIPEGQAR